MADAHTEIDLEVLHAAIEAALCAQFPALRMVEFYREESDRQPPKPDQLPACLLELTELEPAPDVDPGTEQLAVHARFEARLIIGFRTPRAKLEIRQLAAAVAVWLRLRRWADPRIPAGQAARTLPTGPAEVIAILPDHFSPELDRYEVWRVEWRQLLHLGASIWTTDGLTPETPLYNWSPAIGIGHEAAYQPLTEIPTQP